VDKIEIKNHFIVISSLGMLQKETYNDLLNEVGLKKKEDKYKDIKESMQEWLKMYDKEIKQKFYIDKIEVKSHFIVISSLGMQQKDIYKDFMNVVNLKGKRSRQKAKL
jgi:hypothetical protein